MQTTAAQMIIPLLKNKAPNTSIYYVSFPHTSVKRYINVVLFTNLLFIRTIKIIHCNDSKIIHSLFCIKFIRYEI